MGPLPARLFNAQLAADRPRNVIGSVLFRAGAGAGWYGAAPGVWTRSERGSGGRGRCNRGRRRVVGAAVAQDLRRLVVSRVGRRLVRAQLGDLGLEVAEGGERPVDRGEPHVGDLVEVTQRGQDREADLV